MKQFKLSLFIKIYCVVLKDLKELLKKNSTVETLIEWLDSIVDAKVNVCE